MVIGDILL